MRSLRNDRGSSAGKTGATEAGWQQWFRRAPSSAGNFGLVADLPAADRSNRVPRLRGNRIAALVELDVIDDRFDGLAGQAGIDDALGQ